MFVPVAITVCILLFATVDIFIKLWNIHYKIIDLLTNIYIYIFFCIMFLVLLNFLVKFLSLEEKMSINSYIFFAYLSMNLYIAINYIFNIILIIATTTLISTSTYICTKLMQGFYKINKNRVKYQRLTVIFTSVCLAIWLTVLLPGMFEVVLGGSFVGHYDTTEYIYIEPADGNEKAQNAPDLFKSISGVSYNTNNKKVRNFFLFDESGGMSGEYKISVYYRTDTRVKVPGKITDYSDPIYKKILKYEEQKGNTLLIKKESDSTVHMIESCAILEDNNSSVKKRIVEINSTQEIAGVQYNTSYSEETVFKSSIKNKIKCSN